MNLETEPTLLSLFTCLEVVVWLILVGIKLDDSYMKKGGNS